MENLVFTQLSIPEIRQLFRQELENYFSDKTKTNPKEEENGDLLTVEEAAKFLSLTVPTIYGLTSKGKIPVMKRSKRCYFSKQELLQYLKEGRRKTASQIADEVKINITPQRKYKQ